MKRWFIARMGNYDGEGTVVPATNKYVANTRIWSKPGIDFCLGQLGAASLVGINNDPDIKLIPDAALDNLLTTIPAAVRSAMIVNLTEAGFDVSAVKGSWSIRQLLKHLKLQLQTDDDIESGDVRDLG
jgi:hypothetical protein